MKALRTTHVRAVPALLLIAALLPAPAVAQTCGGMGAFDITLSTSSIIFPTPDLADFNAGQIDYPSTVTITVEPRNKNRIWNLCLRASSASMGGSKPVTDLRWSQDGLLWFEVSTTDELVLSGVGAQSITLSFRMRLDWTTDAPDTYIAPLEFTASHL